MTLTHGEQFTMSIRVMTEVWEHSTLKGTPLLIMLALADYCNDERYCWPGVETLAHKARISTRQTQRILKAMVEQGYLSIAENEGRKGTNIYTLPPVNVMKSLPDLDLSEVVTCASPVTCVSGGGDMRVAKVVTCVSPEPSLNRHESSSADSLESASPVAKRITKPRKQHVVTEWERQRWELGKLFSERTQVPIPEDRIKELNMRWWTPLKAIYEMVKDFDETREVVEKAIDWHIEKRLALAAPQSIQQTAISFAGEIKRGSVQQTAWRSG